MSANTHNYMTVDGVKPFVLHSDYVALLARHNALVEAVAWERECGEMRFTDIWFDEWSRTESQSKNAMRELRATVDAARAEVDRLLAEEGI